MHVNEYLLQLANRCDQMGYQDIADELDQLLASGSFAKVAQYVGVIGYALKQERAVANCLRKKRLDSDRPMQEIVMSCLQEYQDGVNYSDEEWVSKYAESNISQYVDSFLKEAVANGVDPQSAVKQLASDMANDNEIFIHAEKVSDVWRMITEAELNEDDDFSDFGDVQKKIAQLNFWQGAKNLWRKMRGGEGRQVQGLIGEIHTELQNIIRDATSVQPDLASVKKVIKDDPLAAYPQFIQKTYNYLQRMGVTASSWHFEYKTAQLPPAPGATPTAAPGTPPAPTPAPTPAAPSVPSQQLVPLVQRVYQIAEKIRGRIEKINNLIAKLRTFQSINTDPKLRGLSKQFFDAYQKWTSPFDLTTANSLSDIAGNMQQELATVDNTATPITPATPAGTPTTPAKTPTPSPAGPSGLFTQFMSDAGAKLSKSDFALLKSLVMKVNPVLVSKPGTPTPGTPIPGTGSLSPTPPTP